jgi:hypothetical protein
VKFVFVDGVNKGEVFKGRAGRWHWRRGEVAVEPFARGSTLGDVAEWARKCCNGKTAVIQTAKQNKKSGVKS